MMCYLEWVVQDKIEDTVLSEAVSREKTDMWKKKKTKKKGPKKLLNTKLQFEQDLK